LIDDNITNENYLNTTQMSGTNIISGNYIGGNYWAKPDGTGFSENCNIKFSCKCVINNRE